MAKKLMCDEEIRDAAKFYAAWFWQMYSMAKDVDRITVLKARGFENASLSTIRTVRLMAETMIMYTSEEIHDLSGYLNVVNVHTSKPETLAEKGLFLSGTKGFLLSLNKNYFNKMYQWTEIGWEEV